MEDGSPGAFYMPPSLCGTRDGVFYANCGDLAAQPKFAMRTLTAHEAVPGHHFQIALANEMEGLPYFRKAADAGARFHAALDRMREGASASGGKSGKEPQ